MSIHILPMGKHHLGRQYNEKNIFWSITFVIGNCSSCSHNSREWRDFRVYGGGEYLIDKTSSTLKPLSVHGGIEYRGSKPFFRKVDRLPGWT